MTAVRAGRGGSISSPSNPRIQRARRLKRRADRDETGLFLVEGQVAVATALEAKADVVEIFCSDDDSAGSLADAAAKAGAPIVAVSEAVARALADTTTPQGIVGVARMPQTSLEDLPEHASLVLVLADVRDPGNAGTLVRTAVAAGADAVIFSDGCTDPFGPKTVRSSAGNLFWIPVLRKVSLGDALTGLRARGMKVLGLDAAARSTVTAADLTEPVALVLGNEAWGLPPESGDLLDEKVRIEMPGPAESLNVAMAGAIVLFEAVRQRGGLGRTAD